MSFEELKADCLIQLLCMSKKRVLATLEGKEMSSSSDSDDSVDNQRKQKLEAERKDDIVRKRLHKGKKVKSLKKKKVETVYGPKEAKSDEKEGKTLLEILELEMKAKAIRALLKPNQVDNEPKDTQIEEAIKNEIIAEKTVENKSEDMSWNERYEEREDVKEVIKTSRLCTNMRRRMLLHQQKMLADRAKLKAEEDEKIKSVDTVKSELKEKLENVYPIIDEQQSNDNKLENKSNNIVEGSSISGDYETIEKVQEIKKVDDDNVVVKQNVNSSGRNEHVNVSNAQESTDDDSQKSTDFERVLNEYTQKNTDLETTINEYSQKNTDLEQEINKCSKRNDDMENAMNKCAQKNSDIESAINNYSVKNNDVDETIASAIEKTSDLNTAIGEYSKKSTDLNKLISQYSKKNVDLKAIVNDYSKRNSEFMTLMSEYSQNNVDIQSVIGEYTEGNHKLETIIDEYSDRNTKIKNMIDEYSTNNCNVEKIIDRNNRKQLLIDKYNVESAAGKAANLDSEEKFETTNIICESKCSNDSENVIDSTILVDKSVDEKEEKSNLVN